MKRGFVKIISAAVWVAMAYAALPCPAEWIFDGEPSAPAGGVVSVEEGTFPVLRLELGGAWTDFELKASTNNFTNLVYYVLSSRTNDVADDPDVWVHFTDDYGADVRVWNKSSVSTSIVSQLASESSEVEYVIVQPSHECAVPWAAWMSATNSKLVWSFVRYDGINLEMNFDGNRSHWNATVPVEWRKERISP